MTTVTVVEEAWAQLEKRLRMMNVRHIDNVKAGFAIGAKAGAAMAKMDLPTDREVDAAVERLWE